MKITKSSLVSGCLLAMPALLQAGENPGMQPILVHPFHKATPTQAGTGAALSGNAAMKEETLQERSRGIVRQWGLNPRISPQTKNHQGFSLYQDNRIETLEMGFQVDGFPLCQFQVKFHETLKGGMAIFGNIPRLDIAKSFTPADWPENGLVSQRIVETLTVKGIDSQFKVESRNSCLWTQGSELLPVWEMEVSAGRKLYTIIADGQDVYLFSPKHFDATGKAKTFPNNVNDTDRVEYQLRDMTGSGYLENPYFKTCVPSGTKDYTCPPDALSNSLYSFVKEAQLNYDYDPSSNEDAFVQTSIFTNANRTLEWFQGHGYVNPLAVPIRLYAHAVFDGDMNNALYEPHQGFSIIYVGDGDGEILQNLGTDADVVGHEFGHHVIYKTIKRIDKEEPLVLHEGLADYFTFSRTGNACLGESICPESSVQTRVCMIPKRCLRTAENDYTYGSKTLPREVHLKSQFISGMLWDLTVKDNIPVEDVTKLVLKTIDLMVSDSGYAHWVVGMMLTDDAFFKGANCATIRNRVIARGLESYVKDISCDMIQEQDVFTATSTASIADYPPFKATTPAKAEAKKSSSTKCGSISGASSHGHDLSLLLLWILPLATTFYRRFRG